MARKHQIKVKGRSQLLATWPDQPTRASINISRSFTQYTGVTAGNSPSNSLEGLVLVCRKLSDLVFTRTISYRVLGQRSSKGLDTGSWEQRHYNPLLLWCKQKMGQRLASCLRVFLVEHSQLRDASFATRVLTTQLMCINAVCVCVCVCVCSDVVVTVTAYKTGRWNRGWVRFFF